VLATAAVAAVAGVVAAAEFADELMTDWLAQLTLAACVWRIVSAAMVSYAATHYALFIALLLVLLFLIFLVLCRTSAIF
jgi:hypothetical protein